MGTHSSGPSFVKGSLINQSQSLKDYLNGQDLSFLFKVLSVNTALSIQAHPDLSLAKQLYEKDPNNYRDANHKPEMAIVLGDFEALCGFRRCEKIAEFAEEFEGFSNLIGNDGKLELKLKLENSNSSNDPESEKKAIKDSFERLMKSSKEDIIKSISLMPSVLESCKKEDESFSNALKLFHRLNQQYPNDVGVFCVFFMNHFTLKSGEAIFLAANEPHAYLKGSCIECMATSDNVVRAGLTPKHRDVNVLCSMLTYNSFNGIDELLTKPMKIRPFAHLYKSPVPEFSVLRINLEGMGTIDENSGTAPLYGKSIILCTEGSALLKLIKFEQEIEMSFGSVIYLPAECEYKLTGKSGNTTIYQAFEPLPL